MNDFSLDIVLAALLAALPGIAALVMNFRKTKKEIAKLDADTGNAHAEAADKWANQVNNLLDRVSRLEEQLKDIQIELKKWQNWAGRLVKQVRSLGHEPVPFEESKTS